MWEAALDKSWVEYFAYLSINISYNGRYSNIETDQGNKNLIMGKYAYPKNMEEALKLLDNDQK